MKATEQYLTVVLCCTRWFELFSLWVKSLSVTIQMKAFEQYFSVMLFTMLYELVLTFDNLGEIHMCDYSITGEILSLTFE